MSQVNIFLQIIVVVLVFIFAMITVFANYSNKTLTRREKSILQILVTLLVFIVAAKILYNSPEADKRFNYIVVTGMLFYWFVSNIAIYKNILHKRIWRIFYIYIPFVIGYLLMLFENSLESTWYMLGFVLQAILCLVCWDERKKIK